MDYDDKLVEAFRTLFPILKYDVADYMPYNLLENSIRVRFYDGLNLIFTYKSANEWKVQTYESYLNEKELKGENK